MLKKIFLTSVLIIVCYTTTYANTTTNQADSTLLSTLNELRVSHLSPEVTKQRLDELSQYEEQVSDHFLLGELYRQRGHYEQDYGNTAVAHINFQQAIEYFSSIKGEKPKYFEAECLVAMATEFYSLRDTIGLNSVIDDLTDIYNQYDYSPRIAYQYHHAAYHLAECKYRYTNDKSDLNNFFSHLYGAIRATEQMTDSEMIESQINPAWDYYNLASGYDVFYTPKPIDSINKYIDLCDQHIYISHIPSDSTNLVYHVENERVWLQYYQHKYDSVEYGFNRLLDMLANDRHLLYRDLILNQQQLYLFIKEYNREIGNYRNAYKYQQMQYEEERKIFDVEKMKAISNIEIQYEAEKKQQEIESLRQQNELIKRNYIISIVVVLSIFIILVLLYIIKRSVSKNKEQQLYEAALEAELQKENQNTNIRQIIKRMINDFPKYEDNLNNLDIDKLQYIISQAQVPITSMDMQYIIAFQGMNLKPIQVAEMFNVEPASVYSVRYRIRKKFPKEFIESNEII